MVRVSIDNIPQFRNWIRSTDKLRDALKYKIIILREREEACAREEDAILKEISDIEKQIEFLNSLLPEKPLALPKPMVDPNKKWHPNYNACVNCHRNTVRHTARGLCVSCYSNVVIRKNPKYAIQSKIIPENPE